MERVGPFFASVIAGVLILLPSATFSATTCIEVPLRKPIHQICGFVYFPSGDRIPNAEVTVLRDFGTGAFLLWLHFFYNVCLMSNRDYLGEFEHIVVLALREPTRPTDAKRPAIRSAKRPAQITKSMDL